MEKILVLDFGGQYDQLIARRVREQNVYAEIISFDKISLEEIVNRAYRGIILTGGPNSVYLPSSPTFDKGLFEAGIPVLGICYGAQLMAHILGGEVTNANSISEYGRAELNALGGRLFKDVPEGSVCWMSHTDYIRQIPEGFKISAVTPHCPCAAFENEEKSLYGVQFHPEVTHSEYGTQILKSFLFDVCKCTGDWHMESFAEDSIRALRQRLSGKRVLLALSGGVDSSVAALLLNKAIGDRLICVFVDHGLLRKDEGDFVENTFKHGFGINFIRVNAQERFISALKGATEPEQKRKIIGTEFIRVFEKTARSLGKIEVLAQGTIYPDVVESGKGGSAVIKSHHNVGGLPERMEFDEIVEPLKDLFKDEVRAVGALLGLPKELVWRQPFPGPGLAVRITGEVTWDKLEALRDADAIFRQAVDEACPDNKPDQYFAVMTDVHSVGVKGDARYYGLTVALRAVNTDDFMTAEWTRLPYEALETASNRIVNEVPGVARVVYDITGKPPATVEWE